VNKRRRKGRFFAASFGLTIIALVGLMAVLILTPQSSSVPNSNLPNTLPTYPTAWAKYVPSDILEVSMINYSLIRALNSSAVPADEPLELVSPNESITPDMVRATLTITFQTPNATVAMIYLTKSSFGQFALSVVEAHGQEPGTKPSLYYTMAKVGNQSASGWLALIPSDNIVAFAIGSSPARTGVNLALEASNGTVPNILQNTTVRQILYIVNGTENHLSFSIQNFPGVVQTGSMTGISVDCVGSSIHISYVVEFNDSSTAKSQVDYMKTSYQSASVFNEYDQYLEALEYRPFSQMQFAVRLVG
jgi:hypothetical protein